MASNPPPPAPPAKRPLRRVLGWGRRLIIAAVLFVLVLGGAVVVLDSPLGHRFIADRIAAIEPQSGLRVRIGRIDGTLFGAMSLHEVVLSDPQGRFMVVPEATLDWRPFNWFGLDPRAGLMKGLDIRALILRRATLLRVPQLRPGDPEAPILPDFDIRIDKLAAENLTIEREVMGQRRRIDIAARADIRRGRARIDLGGRLGGRDRLRLHLDSEPDRNRFALDFIYNAPKDGLLAALTGVKRDIAARAGGKGTFREWHGWGAATDGGRRLAAFQLDAASGRYKLAGQVFPGDLANAPVRRAVGDALSLVAEGTAADGRVKGHLFAAGAAFAGTADGALDLVNSRVEAVKVKARLARPELLIAPPGPELAGVRLDATVDGRFTALAIIHDLRAARLRSGTVLAEGLRTAGTAHWDGKRLRLPLALSAERVRTGEAMLDPRLPGARLTGDLVLAGGKLTSDRLDLTLRGASARLALIGDLARSTFALSGPVTAQGILLRDLGQADAQARVRLSFGAGQRWTLTADATGRMTRIDNGSLAALTGGNVRLAAALALGGGQPLVVRRAELVSAKLTMALHSWAMPNGAMTVAGDGRHLDYGPFTFEAALAEDGPRASLVLADPLPAASLKDVHVMLSPAGEGFRIETKGDSRLGPFSGLLALTVPQDGAPRLGIERFTVYQTEVTGSLVLAKAGVTGGLALVGGGVNGTIDLAPDGAGQGLKAAITARGARFGGDNPIAVGNATLTADGHLEDGNSTLQASLKAEGISSGKLFIGRLIADAALVNGSGSVTASLAGRRGTSFALQGTGAFSPDRIVAFVAGDYAGRAISMPRRAVLEREPDAAGGGQAAGWRLQPTQIDFGRGSLIASGHVLGGATQLRLLLSRMPLSVLDIVLPDLGMGGLASGVIDYENDHLGAPAGHAAVEVKGLTRSGLVLTSRPLDLALVAELDPAALQVRAVAREGGTMRGRLQALVSDLPRGGTMLERLRGGSLKAELGYSGPAEALWRLAAIEVVDLTGPLGAAARVTGSIDHPVITGAVATRALRVQSNLTGSDVREVEALGSFADARLSLAHFSGTTPGGGTVSGSGSFDFTDVATHGVGLDLRLASTNALLINRDDMAATVTGPLRLVSSGIGGTIAGRVRIDKARWTLGRSSVIEQLPAIATRESNLRADVAPPRAPYTPWKYLIDAVGADRIDVRGLGLESEWGADVRLRGDTTNPQIFGSAALVRGGYEFAGRRFDLTRGRIRFVGEVPVDPRLDIVAEGDANGVSAKIAISGSALKPQIAFSSVPALPEEELLSRMLFGSSITQISAPEAVQLASALSSLRSGGGLDPINRLRNAIGLDRLRIVSADASIGRSTSVAVGKYIGRRIFVELITDGRGYSATSAEFRVTRWLVLLGTISTIGDESINLKASKDY
ncbi:MAG: translocation/assembly module TamB domain-containing protein [Novosphingobium sp.]|uniref:translocation/assembly module TamB domain-containing protein n=1 Tax=Novosphingobium sp. TaxID=1874826 RepID=UPI00301B656F